MVRPVGPDWSLEKWYAKCVRFSSCCHFAMISLLLRSAAWLSLHRGHTPTPGTRTDFTLSQSSFSRFWKDDDKPKSAELAAAGAGLPERISGDTAFFFAFKY